MVFLQHHIPYHHARVPLCVIPPLPPALRLFTSSGLQLLAVCPTYASPCTHFPRREAGVQLLHLPIRVRVQSSGLREQTHLPWCMQTVLGSNGVRGDAAAVFR